MDLGELELQIDAANKGRDEALKQLKKLQVKQTQKHCCCGQIDLELFQNLSG